MKLVDYEVCKMSWEALHKAELEYLAVREFNSSELDYYYAVIDEIDRRRDAKGRWIASQKERKLNEVNRLRDRETH